MSMDKAQALRALHVSGAPLILYNVWDAGSALAVAGAGAKALATGSWSVAAAQGFADGEALPLGAALACAAQIVAAVDLPVSIDFEGGYAVDADQISANTAALAATGAVGLNFEDQRVGGAGLYAVAEQAGRVAAVRAGDAAIVINARTDVFLKEPDASKHAGLVDAALERGAAYAAAGADCFFVPGLTDLTLIAQICAASDLPVNVMHSGAPSAIPALAQAGVARISHGPNPYRWAMAHLRDEAKLAIEQGG